MRSKITQKIKALPGFPGSASVFMSHLPECVTLCAGRFLMPNIYFRLFHSTIDEAVIAFYLWPRTA